MEFMLNKGKLIKQVWVSEAVYRPLKGAIFEWRFVTGAKLPPERELIENLQVSWTFVREAIKGVDAGGLIEVKQGAVFL